MSYPPETLRSSHEADGRSDRSGGSGGATSSSGVGVYCSTSTDVPATTTTTNYKLGNYQYIPSNIASPPQSQQKRSVINCNKWSRGMDFLLQDGEGVSLFKNYLQSEHCANLLDFWFACQGFKSKVDPSDKHKITQLIKAIYRTYIKGSGVAQSTSAGGALVSGRTDPIRLRNETRRQITERISRKHSLDQTVFDTAQSEVEQFLRSTAYPAFLKSDLFVEYLQTNMVYVASRSPYTPTVQLPSIDPSAVDFVAGHTCGSSKLLPTLDEDRELKSEELVCANISGNRPCCTNFEAVDHSSGFQPNYCQYCLRSYPQQSQQQKPATVYPMCPAGSPHQGWRPQLQSQPIMQNPNVPPLTMENLQISRTYRADLSVHKAYVDLANQQAQQSHLSIQRRDHRQPRPNYVQTHWPADLNPSAIRHSGTPGFNRFLTSPPNPYHTSYAPVSTRDSEHHSLSSDARTEETQSHTDSSLDAPMNRLLQSSFCQQQSQHPFPHHYQHRLPTPSNRDSNYPHHQFRPPRDHSNPLLSPPIARLLRGSDHSTADNATAKHSRRQSSDKLGVSSSKRHHHYATGGAPSSTKRPDDDGQDVVKVASNRPDQQQKPLQGQQQHNLVERDPKSFHDLLCSKLQSVLDDRSKSERLQELISKTSPLSGTEKPQQDAEKKSLDADKNIEPPIVPDDDAKTSSSTTTTVDRSVTTSLLQRPWVDKLLAAARIDQNDDAQAILEDHCSRIWAGSADRTPSSNGSGGDQLPSDLLLDTSYTSGHPRQQVPVINQQPPPHIDLLRAISPSVDLTFSSNSHSSSSGNRPEPLPVSNDESPPHQLSIGMVATDAVLSNVVTTSTTTNSSSSVTTTSGSSRCSAVGGPTLVIGYYYGDDPVPYRSLWQGHEITLGQFKSLIPRKRGQFRYFFKKASDEFDSGCVHQEVTHDSSLLPLWEGKVVAKVERID